MDFKTPEEARRAWMEAMGATPEDIERDILEHEPVDLAVETAEYEALLRIWERNDAISKKNSKKVESNSDDAR